MPDLQAMFKPLVPGVCSAKSFMRVVRLLDISEVESEFSLHELSDIFGATLFVEGDRVIKYGRILAALRDHCEIRPAQKRRSSEGKAEEETNSAAEGEENHLQPLAIATRDLFDHIFDSKTSILESCQMIDVDATGNLCFDDFVAGISAATQANRIETEKLIRLWFETVVFRSVSAKLNSLSQVPYGTLLASLELTTNEFLPVSAEGWEQWTARLLREQA